MRDAKLSPQREAGRWFALLAWWLPAAVIVLSAALWHPGPALTAAWTGALLVMATGCLVNARRCGRLHCYFTGPFFLAMAVAVALHGSGQLDLGPAGWAWLGNTIGIGGLALYLLPERIWGRYRRRG